MNETPSFSIPKKSYFKLEEICSITGIKPYVLKFWESEFPSLKPITGASGQKVYTHRDLEVIKLIKKALIDEKYSIAELKNQMYGTKVVESKAPSVQVSAPVVTESPVLVSKSEDEETAVLLLAKGKINDLLSKINAIKRAHQWI